MSQSSNIEWTDTTWNCLVGCTRVSAGCDLCYAAQLAATRLKHRPEYQGLAVITASGRPAFTGTVRFLNERLNDPLHWRKPRRVFVNSMSDLFHDQVTDDQLDRIFAVMALTPRHIYQVLTKRPERMLEYFHDGRAGAVAAETGSGPDGDRNWPFIRPDDLGDRWPLPNVWLGVSVENQETAEERIPLLLQTPAAVRWISAEPLLGPIDLRTVVRRAGQYTEADRFLPGLDWVVAGGESGPQARPCDVDWIRSIVQQCQEAGVPVFVKQLGAWVSGEWPTDERGHCRPQVNRWLFPDGMVWVPGIIGDHNYTRPDGAIACGLGDRKGGTPSEWPDDLRVREFPPSAKATAA